MVDYVLWFDLGRPHLSCAVVRLVIRETRDKENFSAPLHLAQLLR